MNCLLVAATSAEIGPFLEAFRERDNLPVTDILISGVGLTASTYSLTRQFSVKKPDLVIQAGIAGCFDKKIKLGAVLVVKQEMIADQGVTEKGTLSTLFDLGLQRPDEYPFSKEWLVNRSTILQKTKLKKVKAVTVNQVSVSKQTIARYINRFNPVLESMEGAALHYTCLVEKIPFIQLRGVSNYIGERNKKHWMIKEAVKNLNHELIRLLTII